MQTLVHAFIFLHSSSCIRHLHYEVVPAAARILSVILAMTDNSQSLGEDLL